MNENLALKAFSKKYIYSSETIIAREAAKEIARHALENSDENEQMLLLYGAADDYDTALALNDDIIKSFVHLLRTALIIIEADKRTWSKESFFIEHWLKRLT